VTVRNNVAFLVIGLIVAALLYAGSTLVQNQYVYYAGYAVLQYVVLATAWNILGGYCGYVNFGSAAFFALGVYTTVVIHKLSPMPIPVVIVAGGIVSGSSASASAISRSGCAACSSPSPRLRSRSCCRP
jgi:branched-chain amino acid transport system permease protein